MSLDLTHPVLVAAGCGGTGRELALEGVGGLVTRTITLTARAGAAAPRIEESPAGWLRALGVPNPGLDQFLALELPGLVQRNVPVIVSIAAERPDELAELARRIGQAPGVRAVEVGVGAVLPEPTPAQLANVVETVLPQLPAGVPLIAKVGLAVPGVVGLARAAVAAGAGALTIGGGLPAAMRDGRPAELSGPAIAPVAMAALLRVRQALPEVPLLSGGGVTTAEDARLRLAAGATAVQLGAALLHDPTTAARLAAEIGEAR
ncbi:tRNA-dihydrouridine synthase [Nocardioides dubius]|uniref:Dihydroorotate dehydrogenase n=1 Tax=Nocardioides dubius TaxID=317019 RepID=A0ABP4EB16_9ACTN